MARSMTGFGRGSGLVEGETVSVEVSAVNHRFLEPSFRLPYVWNGVEPALRNLLKKRVARGKVNISIRRERGPAGRTAFCYDAGVAKQYIAAARELAGLMSSTDGLSLNALMGMEGVFYPEETTQDLDVVKAELSVVFESALEQFNAAREAEGAVLLEDLAANVSEMRDALAVVEGELPSIAEAYEARLRTRLAELNAEVGLKEERIALEVAMMAEKTDVNEEVVRLKAHYAHVDELLSSNEPLGRELNFLAQEIQRAVDRRRRGPAPFAV